MWWCHPLSPDSYGRMGGVFYKLRLGWAAKVAVFLGLVFYTRLRIRDVFSLSLWTNSYSLPTFDKVVLVTGNVNFYFGGSIENGLTWVLFALLPCYPNVLGRVWRDSFGSLAVMSSFCVHQRAWHWLPAPPPTHLIVCVGCCRMTVTVRRRHKTCLAVVTPTSPSQRQVRTFAFLNDPSTMLSSFTYHQHCFYIQVLKETHSGIALASW